VLWAVTAAKTHSPHISRFPFIGKCARNSITAFRCVAYRETFRWVGFVDDTHTTLSSNIVLAS
jgi:hypothetical protein